MAAAPVPDPEIAPNREILRGDIPSPLEPPSGCVFRTRCRYAVDKCAEILPPPVELGGRHDAACIRIGEF